MIDIVCDTCSHKYLPLLGNVGARCGMCQKGHLIDVGVKPVSTKRVLYAGSSSHAIDAAAMEGGSLGGTYAQQLAAGVLVTTHTSLGEHTDKKDVSMLFIPDVQLGEMQQVQRRYEPRVSIFPPGPLPEGVVRPYDVKEVKPPEDEETEDEA